MIVWDIITLAVTPPTPPHLWEHKHLVIRGQILDIWKTGSFLPSLAPVSYMKLLGNTGTFLPSGWRWGWVTAIVLRAEINLNLPSVSSAEVTSLQESPEFQNSYISQSLPVQLLFTLGDRFLMLPTVTSSLISNPFFFKWFMFSV